eukprot:TRINITY_DN1498_c0_g2_i1.p1 TRINITY_DN1498_c0_g2~~TRINITY_DN1498_c0_g2_i1.p1  ORF type:complete len:467 (-),score=53.85 TRINITY_DN1498_c0_g2_i1:61-1461(-)
MVQRSDCLGLTKLPTASFSPSWKCTPRCTRAPCMLQNTGDAGTFDRELAASLPMEPGQRLPFPDHQSKCSSGGTFQRMFLGLGPRLRGLRHCRRVYSADATFLKGNAVGTLFSLIAEDPAGQLYPAAFAVVSGNESQASWSYFFGNLLRGLEKNSTAENDLLDFFLGGTMFSDRDKGIDPSMQNLLPSMLRRYCSRHVAENAKVTCRRFCREADIGLLLRMAQATSPNTFRALRGKLSRSVENYFARSITDVKQFTDAFADRATMGCRTSNFAESWNAVLGKLRRLPITGLIDGIVAIIVGHETTRSKNQFDTSFVCKLPRSSPVLKEHQRPLQHCFGVELQMLVQKSLKKGYPSRTKLEDGVFVCATRDRGSETVSLNASHSMAQCTCNLPLLYGFPCIHVIAAIQVYNDTHESKLNPADFVSTVHTVTNYVSLYGGSCRTCPIDRLYRNTASSDDIKLLPPEKF